MRRHWWTIALVALVCLVVFSDVAFASETEVKKRTLWELFQATGVVGWLIVILSIIGTALSIDHGLHLRESTLLPPYLVQEIDQLIEEEDYEGAASLCEKNDSYFAKILLAGFQSVGLGGTDQVIAAMEQTASEETFKLNAKISYINLIGNLGPLVGLLGTVTGMISSFQVIAATKSPTPAMLAEGVYEALVNTTMGLFISISFLTVFFVFKNKIQSLTLQANTIAHDVLKRISAT
jgi:biopolymer transport protein ExbB